MDKEFTEYGVEEEVVSTQKSVADFFQKNIYEIAIVLVCVVRVIAGLANIQESGKSVAELIGESIMSMVFAFMLARMLECKGLAVGGNADCYKKAIENYQETSQRAGKHIHKMDQWCKKYTDEKYKETVTRMLYPLGLSFEQYKNGTYDEQKFSKMQKWQLAKVRNFKAHAYSTEELMSGELDFKPHKDYSKVSKKEYIKRSSRSDVLMKVIVAVVFGYFSLPPISQWDWGSFIWTLFETVVIFGLSVMKYFNAYNYVVEDICEKVVNKTTILNRFLEEVGSERDCPIAAEAAADVVTGDEKEIKGEKEDGENKVGLFSRISE